MTLLISAVFLLIGQQQPVTLDDYKKFLLPAPLNVWEQFVSVVQDGRLARHALITVDEVAVSVFIGCILTSVLGYSLAKSALVEYLVGPNLVASQAIPIIVIAPLLMLWVPNMYWSWVVVAVLVLFFLILVNMITGVRSVSAELNVGLDLIPVTARYQFRTPSEEK